MMIIQGIHLETKQSCVFLEKYYFYPGDLSIMEYTGNGLTV